MSPTIVAFILAAATVGAASAWAATAAWFIRRERRERGMTERVIADLNRRLEDDFTRTLMGTTSIPDPDEPLTVDKVLAAVKMLPPPGLDPRRYHSVPWPEKPRRPFVFDFDLFPLPPSLDEIMSLSGGRTVGYGVNPEPPRGATESDGGEGSTAGASK